MRRWVGYGAALATMGILFAYPRYQQQKQARLNGLRTGSQIAQTPFGPLEYAVEGTGQPMLIMHGSGGGYDQGLLFTHVCSPQNHQIIAVSRPGYHRTSLETGRTPEEQADACAALLDTLNIKEGVVLGISAGGLSAIQFALRHPDRCRALVLLSAATPAIQTMHAPPFTLSMLRFMMASDFIIWIMLKISSKMLVGTMTGKIMLEQSQDDKNKAIVDAIIQGLFPASLWREGTINDIEQVADTSLEALRQISVPTLLIHGTNDMLVPFAVAQSSAAIIPNTRLVTIEEGSHLIVGTHRAIIAKAIDTFINL